MKYLLLITSIVILNCATCQCDSIPLLNQHIIELVSKKLGKKVDRGECWDLARYVLDELEAKWDGKYVFGRLLSKKECIAPGDIVQFEKVLVKFKDGDKTITEKMAHHTAIVFKVISVDKLVLAHQNTGYSGKKVGKSELLLSSIKSGTVKIYRPER